MRYLLFSLFYFSVLSVLGQGTKPRSVHYDARVFISYPLLLKSEIKSITDAGLGLTIFFAQQRRIGLDIDAGVAGFYQLPSKETLYNHYYFAGLRYDFEFGASSGFSPYLHGGYSFFSTTKSKAAGPGVSAGIEWFFLNTFGIKAGFKKIFGRSVTSEKGIPYPIKLNIIELGFVYKFAVR